MNSVPRKNIAERSRTGVVNPRLASMDAAEAKRKPVGGDDMDASETVSGDRERAPTDGGDGLGNPNLIAGRDMPCARSSLGLSCG